MYTVHRVSLYDGSQWLSPHHFGWPASRPRSYTVLTKDATCGIRDFSATLNSLFRKVNVGVESILVAPAVSWASN